MKAQPVQASLVTIGDELLVGQTIDTNSAYIAQALNRIGIWVRRRVAVGDVYDEIWQTLDAEKKESDIIIITGGLGPTADDITKPLLARYFGGKLVSHERTLDHIRYLFTKVFRRPEALLERNFKQAEVPDNCHVLFNRRGTAPGMWFEQSWPEGQTLIPAEEATILQAGSRRIIISLPGVPHEMKGLMENEVIPRLQQSFVLPAIVHKTLLTAGQGESLLAEMLVDFESRLPENIKLAYLPNFGMVKLRLTAREETAAAAEALVQPVFENLQSIVKEYLVATEDIGLEVVVGRLLKEHNQSLSTAESCTGGYIAQLLTSQPGASAWYRGSVVAYDNRVKEEVLGVTPETLATKGAVSEETVREMVSGALKLLKTDFALAVSGIMGPDGGTPEKPVGTVWIAAGNRHEIRTRQLQLRFDRHRNITQTATWALDWLRRLIIDTNKG